MRFPLRARVRWAALIAVVGAFAAGGIAYATIPDAGGVIHGCYKKSGGTLRVIDVAVTTCASNETALSWNQTGPAGATGPQGEPGVSLFANVDHLGNLTSGTATGASRVDEAEYEVVFDRDVSECAGTASLGTNEGEGENVVGVIDVFMAYADDSTVVLTTRDVNGSRTDSSFHLIVVC